MISAHRRRRDALRELIRAAELDGLLVTNLVNVRYLTGFTGSNAALLVGGADPNDSADEDGTLFSTDGRYLTQATEQVPELHHLVERSTVVPLVKAAAVAGVERLGFESDHLTVDQHAALLAAAEPAELVRAPGLVQQLRVIKDDSEIATLRAACAAADAALADLLDAGGIRAGRTEQDVAVDLEALMRGHGAQEPSFETIVAAGTNSAVPHHRPTGAVLQAGDLVKLDFGALVGGYHSDMTRTFVLGRPADWQLEIHRLVAAAQAVGRAALHAGAEVRGVDASAREVISDAGYGAEFLHGLGHGVGLEIHEAPSLGKGGTGTLADGMTVTVEPGVYLPGRGGVRIEDTLVVRGDEPELLTRSDRELLVLDA